MEWTDFPGNWQQFTEAGLNLPGTLVIVHDRPYLRTLLIGHINPDGGADDNGYRELYASSRILRYKRVWQPE